MQQYKEQFHSLLGIKNKPNEHEVHLFERGQKYIQKISKIPGIEMIAIVNSLSMYATHKDSDIDLFIVTQPGMIWFVRFLSTLILWKQGVWRKNDDIAGNFCLSFFITTDALDLSKIAIENDIYLYYWIYYLKPIFEKNNTYEKFLEANNWVQVDEDQRMENQKYIIYPVPFFVCEFYVSIREYFRKKFQTVGVKAYPKSISNATESQRGSFGNLENRSENRYKNEAKKIKTFGTFSHKSTGERKKLLVLFIQRINQIIRFFLLPKTLKSCQKLGNPKGIIISDSILKFHNEDKRIQIRNKILENNFDK